MQLTQKKRAKELMLMLGFDKEIDHLIVANCVYWYSELLWREDGAVLRKGFQ